jgi:hypothetical protein
MNSILILAFNVRIIKARKRLVSVQFVCSMATSVLIIFNLLRFSPTTDYPNLTGQFIPWERETYPPCFQPDGVGFQP